MTTSEPTTGEIVRALRGGGIYGITTALELKVIARLESQERELSGITGELERMTARAEQAERERDAAVAEFDVIAQDGLCEVCFFGDFSEVSKDTCMEDCCFQWRSKKRGLAQEGDGERCRVEF